MINKRKKIKFVFIVLLLFTLLALLLSNEVMAVTKDTIVELTGNAEINPKFNKGHNIGSSGNDEILYVKATNDGGYVALGHFENSEELKIEENTTLNAKNDGNTFILKYDKNDNLEWVRSFGGEAINEVNAIVQTEDGGYIAVGYYEDETLQLGNDVYNNKGLSDMLIVKYSSEGNIEWSRVYGGNGYEELSFISTTTDGGFVVGGYFTSKTLNLDDDIVLTNVDTGYAEGLVIKFDSTGKIEWANSIDGNDEQDVYSLVELENGNIVAVGYTKAKVTISVDEHEVHKEETEESEPRYGEAGFIVELDSKGNYVWSKYEDINGYVTSVAPAPDGGFAVGMNAGDGNIIAKFTADNTESWRETLGDKYSEIEEVSVTRDGGFLVSGPYEYENESLDYFPYDDYDGLIAKLKSTGEVEWVEFIGGDDEDDWVNSATELLDGSVVIGGYYFSKSITVDDVTLTNEGDLDGFLLHIMDIPSIRSECTITVKYQDEDGNKLAEDVVIQGYEGDPYKTEEKQISTYELLEVRGEKEGVFSTDLNEIIYVYKKTQEKTPEQPSIKKECTITVKYQDENGNKLAEDVVIQGYEGEPYKTEEKQISTYELLEVRGEEEGVFSTDLNEIIYVYRKIQEKTPEQPSSSNTEEKKIENKDNTVANSILPRTGTKNLIIILIGASIIILGAISYIKYKKMDF